MVPGSCDTGSARPHDADREDAAIFAPFLLCSRRVLAPLSGACAFAIPITRQIAIPFPKGICHCVAIRGCICIARLGRGAATCGRHAAAASATASLSIICRPLLAELHCDRGLGAEPPSWSPTMAIRCCHCGRLPHSARPRQSPGALAGDCCRPQRLPIPAPRPVAAGGWRTAHRSRSGSADTPAHRLLPVMERHTG